MPIIFNPGYIGPNPPCCDTDCTDENNCPNSECGPCPGPRSACGGCSPPIDPGVHCAVTVAPAQASAQGVHKELSMEQTKDCEACSNKLEPTNPSTPANEQAQ